MQRARKRAAVPAGAAPLGAAAGAIASAGSTSVGAAARAAVSIGNASAVLVGKFSRTQAKNLRKRMKNANYPANLSACIDRLTYKLGRMSISINLDLLDCCSFCTVCE